MPYCIHASGSCLYIIPSLRHLHISEVRRYLCAGTSHQQNTQTHIHIHTIQPKGCCVSTAISSQRTKSVLPQDSLVRLATFQKQAPSTWFLDMHANYNVCHLESYFVHICMCATYPWTKTANDQTWDHETWSLGLHALWLNCSLVIQRSSWASYLTFQFEDWHDWHRIFLIPTQWKWGVL